MNEEEIIQQRMDNEKKGDGGFEKSEQQLAMEAEEADRKKYGRYWVWEGYFNDRNKEEWEVAAEALKHVNEMVIQDIEDFLLLKAFKGQKPKQIQAIIDNDHNERIQNQKKLLGKDGERYEEEQKIENKKRKFMEGIRPPQYWNFIDDSPDGVKVKHVLRSAADPRISYSDGRIEKILDTCEKIGMGLASHEDVKWNQLTKYSLTIFEQEFNTLKENLQKA